MTPRAAAIAFDGRLPGVRCEPALPPGAGDAIRLDVAALVGFAERGPVHVPVPVDDLAQYRAWFGGDLALALDDDGVPVYAALPTAVRSFFDNGGRRCAVVRVVGEGASTSRVAAAVRGPALAEGGPRIAGLAALPRGDVGSPLEPGAAWELESAWPGAWGAGLAVEVRVREEVLPTTGLPSPAAPPELTPAGLRAIEPGDLLHVAGHPDPAAEGGPAGGRFEWVSAVDPRTYAVGSAVSWELDADGVLRLTEDDPARSWPLRAVVRRLRLDVVVRAPGPDGVAVVVERREGLRFCPGVQAPRAGAPCWADVLQPHGAPGAFDPRRSMYLRPAAEPGRLFPLPAWVASPGPAPAAAAAPAPMSPEALALDGLSVFDPAPLFVDPALAGRTIDGLRTALEALELGRAAPLRGLHAVAPAEAVGMVAVPDLYHRRWSAQVVPQAPARELAPPPAAPEAGTFWTCASPPDEPAAEPPPGPDPGPVRMVLEPPGPADLDAVAAVLREIAVLCAARRDLVGVLALPRAATVEDARRLRADLAGHHLLVGTNALSYVGVWHPWPEIPEPATPRLAPLRAVPPDGPACGVLAARELRRGVWVAAAGTTLAGVVGRSPELDRATETALFDGAVNVLRPRPGGFTTTSAHTLDGDRSLLQLSVRRLLILLRKLALREGTRYVFAVDNQRFRDQVRAAFGRMLRDLEARGAIAASQVVVAPVSEAIGQEEGRLRIDLKIAPTSPIEFLTVTLVRSGEQLVAVGGA